MSTDKPPPDGTAQVGPRYPLLERATAAVLLLVLLALGWMALAAWTPEWDWQVSLDVQVGLVLALLTTALILVSIVALLHTHS
ncbi:MAG TPA: hypothetical protein VKA46_40590 [Gemmataceae bacterium]|nr:hypothetical protein [Gemmataceae bacterium]